MQKKNTEYVEAVSDLIDKATTNRPEEIEKVLSKVGAKWIYAKEIEQYCFLCPKCNEQIMLDLRCRWKCAGGCQSIVFNNLIGLARLLLGVDIQPARDLIVDIVFSGLGKTNLVLPINVKGYKGVNLEQCPPEVIVWTVVRGSINSVFTEHKRQELLDYLLRKSSPANSEHKVVPAPPSSTETKAKPLVFGRPSFDWSKKHATTNRR